MTASPLDGKNSARHIRGRRGYRREQMAGLRLELHADVVTRALAEITQNREIEVGGKFIGYVHGSFAADRADWMAGLAALRVSVMAYLDAGPRTDRSAVHHYSDTDYQFQLFQEVARDDPGLRFLGIWHSHHPNGLDTLSRGDLLTGTTAIGNHELDFLLSSLAIDINGLRSGRHFVFVRGHDGVLEIDPKQVQIVEGTNPLTERLDEAAQRVRARIAPAGGEPVEGAGSPENSGAELAWTVTDEGKRVLAQDRLWLGDFPRLQPFRRGDCLVWRGEAEVAGISVVCEYQYPAAFPDAPPVVSVCSTDGTQFLKFTLADSKRRREGFQYALETLARLVIAGRGSCPG